MTSRQNLAQMLQQQEQAAAPIQAHSQGLASMLRQGLAGYMQGADARDRSQAYKTMVQGLSAQPWVNPDTGQVAPGQPPVGGLAGAEAALMGLDNEYAAQMLPQIGMQRAAQEQARAAEQRKFEQQKELAKYKAGLPGGDGMPSDVQTAEWYRKATPEQKAAYDTTKRAQQVLNLGGTLGVLNPRSPTELKSEFPVTPKPEQMPEFKAAVKSAEGAAAAEVDKAALDVKNQKAFSAFDVGMKSVEDTFAALKTDPVTGLFPAVTAKAQMAEGSVSAMAPILKSLFREAGEGTFTDSDQKLLLNMAPKRTDHPEVVKYKTNMIRQIVAAKLGQAAPDTGGEDLLNKGAPNGGWGIRKK